MSPQEDSASMRFGAGFISHVPSHEFTNTGSAAKSAL
jgi:hypothetical protein